MIDHTASALLSVLAFCIAMTVFAMRLGLFKEKCPQCGRRRAGFKHSWQLGGRDLRYTDNPLGCPACGYVGSQRRIASTVAEDLSNLTAGRGRSANADGDPTAPSRPSIRAAYSWNFGAGMLPPLSLLDEAPPQAPAYSEEILVALVCKVELLLKDFHIEGQVVGVYPGPMITRFELELAAGIRGSQVVRHKRSIANGLGVQNIGIVEFIPGRNVIGLEIPNNKKQIVYLSEILRSDTYERQKSPLALALGKNIGGQAVVVDLAKMPHLLIAGIAGSGKSVAINAMVLSLLYKASAAEVRMIMIDPKMLELSVYEGIPHLLAPVVTDMNEAANALRWCTAETKRRYTLMGLVGARNLADFNTRVRDAELAGKPMRDPLFRHCPSQPNLVADPLESLPRVVIILDGYLDELVVYEDSSRRLVSLRLLQTLVVEGRRAGIHIICAAQPFSLNRLVKSIQLKVGASLIFRMPGKVEALGVLGHISADSLEAYGDAFYLPASGEMPERVHVAFVDDHEVHHVVDWLKAQGAPNYIEGVLEEAQGLGDGKVINESGIPQDADEKLYDRAVRIVTESRRVSISGVQLHLRIGYNRAARLIEQMEQEGIVSAPQHNGNREVLAPPPKKN